MRKDLKKIGGDAIISMVAFFTSVIIGLYVYRLLWSGLPQKEFAAWFTVFELSQFFLLFDFGFSHKFISEAREGRADIKLRLGQLRLVLIKTACIASFMLGVIVLFGGVGVSSLRSSYFFLIASLAITLVSYAETAALRVSQKNRLISLFSIVSQASFCLCLFAFSDDLIVGVGISVFVRSLVLFSLQFWAVKEKYRLAGGGGAMLGVDIVAMNLCYFSLFMFDAFVYSVIGLEVAVVAVLLVSKKYFDLLRGLWDAVIPNIYVKLGGENSGKLVLIYCAGCFSAFLLAAFLSQSLISLWVGERVSDFPTLAAMGFSFFGVCVFRLVVLQMFYAKKLAWPRVFFAVLAIKLIFVFVLASRVSNDVLYAYAIQGGMLIALVLVFSKSVANKNS